MSDAERLAEELTAAFPNSEDGGSDAALRMGSVAVDASTCMEAAALLRQQEAEIERLRRAEPAT